MPESLEDRVATLEKKQSGSQAEIKNQIATEYSWKVPEETLSRLHSR